MTKKQQTLIDKFIGLLPDGDKNNFTQVIYYLAGLGYIPQKQNVQAFVISFKHKENGKVISKMGIRKQNAFIGVRFFACENVSAKYLDALRDEIISRNRQYTSPLPGAPDNGSPVKYKCGRCGDICTGGGFGYYYKFSDNDVVSRCGAYPIVIPDIKENDIDELKRVISEQHNYFLSIAR